MDKSREFRREGADVHSDVLVSLSQAILGGTVRIPGIYEEILLNVSGENLVRGPLINMRSSWAHSYQGIVK